MHIPRRTLFIGCAAIAVATGIAAFVLSQEPDDTVPYQDHRIPLEQIRIVDPHPGCDTPHYHALASKSAQATDGTVLPDETDCGYGPVQ